MKIKRKKILANRVYSDSTLKKWTKEQLIEQIRILEHNWASAEESLNNQAKNCEKIIVEQKAEIERLKNAYREGLEQGKFDSQVKIEELQKQVDELKQKLSREYDRGYYFGKQDALSADREENCTAESETSSYEQAVKDTAKEIFRAFENAFSLYYPHGRIPYGVFQVVFEELAKRKGVEVE